MSGLAAALAAKQGQLRKVTSDDGTTTAPISAPKTQQAPDPRNDLIAEIQRGKKLRSTPSQANITPLAVIFATIVKISIDFGLGNGAEYIAG